MEIRIGWEALNPVVSYANRLVCAPGYSFGPRVIRDFQFIYVASGRGSAKIDDRTYEAAEGDLFFYGPDLVHGFKADEADPFVLYGLHFSPAGDIPAAGAVPYRPPADVRWNSGRSEASPLVIGDAAMSLCIPERIRLTPLFAEPFFASAASFFRNADALHHVRNRALLIRFLAELRDKIREEHAENDPAASLMQAVKLKLRERAAEPYQRRWLAEWTRYHENHAASLFARLYGESPHEYFLGCKLELAKSLLAAEGLSPTQTAERLHFGSVHHFTRLFKRRVGCPPGLYRRIGAMV